MEDKMKCYQSAFGFS